MGTYRLNQNQALVEKLEKVVAVYQSADWHQDHFKSPDWNRTDEGAAFIKEIQDTESLGIFDSHFQTIGDHCGMVEIGYLAKWMLERARQVGAKQTVEEVDHYIERETFEAYRIMLLSGLRFDVEVDIGGGVKIVPIQSIPNQKLKGKIRNTNFPNLPMPEISGALVFPFQHKKTHFLKPEPGERVSGTHPDFESAQGYDKILLDARLCLALSRQGGCGVQVIVSTTVAGDDVPTALPGEAWSIYPYRSPWRQVQFTKSEVEPIKHLHENFIKLNTKDKVRLRIPLQKLNECAACGYDYVSAAIALRTALESLFLDSGVSGETTHRLSVRASIFTGGDIEKRKETKKLIKDAYGLCSSAVHSGKFGKRVKEVEKTIEGAAALVRDTLCQMINQNDCRPDWDFIELQGGLPPV